jgi:membrane protease YdiL (CAAX protease family)
MYFSSHLIVLVLQILNLSSGMTIGSVLVISLYSAYIFLGYATFTLKPEFSFSSSKGFISAIKTCWRISRLVIHAFGMGLAISTIEELLFRSWLHEEIAGDLGFHKAVILSGIVFSSLHWYNTLTRYHFLFHFFYLLSNQPNK